MPAPTDILLVNAARHIATIRSIYGRAVRGAELTVDLVNAVRYAILDQHSALEWTANAIVKRYGKPSRRDYFPVTGDPDEFPDLFERNLSGVREARPDVYEAVERHQPYHDGKAVLAELHELSRVNKHYYFSKQDRKESEFTAVAVRGSIIASVGAFDPLRPDDQVMVLGSPPNIEGQVVAAESAHGRFASALRGKVVDWYFSDTPAPVLSTLVSLQAVISEAVADIRRTADLDEDTEVVDFEEGIVEPSRATRLETPWTGDMPEPYTLVYHLAVDGAALVVAVTFNSETGDVIFENGKRIPTHDQHPQRRFVDPPKGFAVHCWHILNGTLTDEEHAAMSAALHAEGT